MTPDSELLATFDRIRSEDAFAELVRRHVNLVYSAALRQVNGDAHLAQDVAQSVFADLARKAGLLAKRQSLAGWLYTSAHFAAAKAVRTETRRREREEKFMREPANSPQSAPDADWESIAPLLDGAMHELKESDREAILLRYFENRSFPEVGAKLGLSENAARMRVERALDKLRAALSKRGMATTGALAAAISAQAVQVAPAGLATSLVTAALAGSGGGGFLLLKLMNATQLKIGISVLAVAGTATAVVVQHQEKDRLRTDNEALVQQVAQLQTDRDNLSKQMASGTSRSLTDSQLQELLQLRGEVSLLRSQTNQIARLHEENKRLLAQIQAVPVRRPAPVSEVDPAEKHAVIAVNAAKQMGLAMRMYLNDNNNQFATNFDQIQVYLGGATNFAGGISLDDFELVNVGVLDERSPQMFMLREKQPVQAADGRWIRIYGCVDGSVQRAASDNGSFDDWEKRFAAASSQGQ